MKKRSMSRQVKCSTDEEARLQQARLETDVEARDELLDRLRSRLGILERELREAQRIAQVQVSQYKDMADIRNDHLIQNVHPYRPRKHISNPVFDSSKLEIYPLPRPLQRSYKKT